MQALPITSDITTVSADVARDLNRGESCLVICDKGWCLPFFGGLRARLRAVKVPSCYLDGRPTGTEPGHVDTGVMTLTIAQLRGVIRSMEGHCVIALPHLDLMTASESGWTAISREVVPLLYENLGVSLLGFADPSVALLPVVEKLFHRRYVIQRPFRVTDCPSG